MLEDIDNCCILLDSTKVSDRKKGAENLKELLSSSGVINLLNKNERRSWDTVFLAVHRFIRKEGEKLYNDESKKGYSATCLKVQTTCSSLLLQVATKANSKEPRLTVTKLLDCIIQCFESSYLRKYFGDTYLPLLVKHTLSERLYWGKIDKNKWLEIYSLLKQLYNNVAFDKTLILEGIYKTIKYGSLHSSLDFNLRQDFNFVRSLCTQLNINNHSKQELVFQFLNTFTLKLAIESRMASCKLGEDVSQYLIELYEPRRENFGLKKSQIFDFLLLQVRLHHPNGATERSDSVYAFDWTKWKQLLRSIYSILHDEIHVILRDSNINSKNELPTLWPNFLALFVEVSHQIFHYGVLDITQATHLENYAEFTQLAKRPRLETGIHVLISEIQTKGNWPWLCILSEMLEIYPETLQPNDFISVLEISSNLQTECNDTVTRHYLYKLLSALVTAQNSLPDEHFDFDKLDTLWTKIWETTLRFVGLNQNEDTIHTQLQLMLKHKKSPQPLELLNIYTSGININSNTIKTLYILYQNTALEFTPNNLETKKYLLNYILNNEKVSNNIFTDQKTSKLLIGLILKSWPYENNIKIGNPTIRKYKLIEHLYILSSFEGGLLFEKIPEPKKNQNIVLVNQELFTELKNSIEIFVNRLKNAEILNMVNGIILVLNIVSELITLKILTPNEINFVNFTELFEWLYQAVNNQKNNLNVEILNSLNMLLSQKYHSFVQSLIREKISVEFLQVFFHLINTDEVDGIDDMDDEPSNSSPTKKFLSTGSGSLLDEDLLKDSEKINLAAFKILTHYTCVPESSFISQTQKHALDTLCNPEFDANCNIEFQMSVYLIQNLNLCKIGTLNDMTIKFIIEAFKIMFEAKFEDYFTSVLLLNIFKDSIPHIFLSNLDKTHIFNLLEPFYKNKDSFAANISIILADCLGCIVENESNVEIIEKLIEFLKNDFHEVRLSAIKNILNIFKTDSNATKYILKKKGELLRQVNKKILESFIIDANINEEQQIDETANRIASALHMYATLIVAHPIWRKQILHYFVQFAAEKNLPTGLIKKVLSIIAIQLEMGDIHTFLNNNVNYLITQWNKTGHRISNFPFILFDCDTEITFFIKYINLVAPVLLQQDGSDTLKKVCIEMNKSVTEVLKDCYPTILAQFLPIYVSDKTSDDNNISTEDLLLSKRLFKQLTEILNCDKDPSIMVTKLDQVIIQLLNRVFDFDHFKNQFDLVEILPEPDPPFFTHDMFLATLKYIEKKLPCNNLSLFAFCIKNYPNKLENILLSVTVDHLNSLTIEDKLSSIHKYSILVDCITVELKSHNQMNIFLIRNITYTLVNIIKLNKDKYELLSIIACRYLQTFCSKILTTSSKVLENFLILIVNSLVPIIKLETNLGKECEKVLNFLIVDNSKYLYNSIGSLDPFPADKKFTKIQEVYEKIKYGNDSFTLEQEIRHFLNIGNVLEFTDRIEGLQHLKNKLSSKKNELVELYSNLNKLRGFCEDCKSSILHQLICMLVKLTTSTNSEVKLEAARCLGELGPADLTTLVLKPEPSDINNKSSPLELVCGEIIVLLSQYLVNNNPEVIQATSNALYSVLSSKEGYLVATSEDKNYESGTLNISYIHPFLPLKKPNTSTNIVIEEQQFCLLNQTIWCPSTECSHSDWITNLVSELLNTFPENCFLKDLIPVCKVKTEFAEHLLPLIIFLILCKKIKKCTNLISKQIQRFFEHHWNGYKNCLSQGSTESTIIFNRASVQCMLNIVHFMRLRMSVCEKNTINELQLNYLHVAQGAQYCSAYFTSVLYAELWCYNKLEEKQTNYQSSSSRSSTLEYVCENQPTEVTLAFENMLREAYKKIGDVDAMHGCGTSYILNSKSLVDYYKNIGQWDKVTLHYDTKLGFEPQNQSSDLAIALKNNSLHYLASNVKSDELTTQYECAWRLNQWDFSAKNENKGHDYEKYHFIALKCLHENDTSGLNQAISQARTCVVNNLAHASLESSKSLYKSLTELQMLQEIENFAEIPKNETSFQELLEKWKILESLNKNEFEFIEPIKAQRITLLNDIYLNENVDLVKPHLVNLHLQLADSARNEGFIQVAHRSLNNLFQIDHLLPEMKSRIHFEQAQLLWLNDKTSGRYLLKYLIDNNSALSLSMSGQALRLYGNWMVETRSENPSTIIENYFEKSLEILNDVYKTGNDVDNLCETLDAYARFADSQYQQVSSYMSSSSFISKVQTIDKFRKMANKLKQPRGDKTSDEKKAIALYERQSQIDEREVKNAYTEKDNYLSIAVTNYLRILELCDSYNLKVFRILSLILENKNNKDLLEILQQNLPLISSYKFIPLLPQLVPHIESNQNELFQKIIQDLLERCASDHPYHTLPIILALAESYKDRNYDASCCSESLETRVQTAKDLITKLKRKKNLTEIVKNMELLSTSLISLAYVDASKSTKSKSNFLIDKRETIRSIKNMNNVLVPTINLEVRKSRNYSNIVGIREFSNNFALVGGVNAPKRISCLGTDGIQRTQLVKGKDDLRQDAVMQQVFTIMNTLLAKNKQTCKLLIRTYKVVPLSQRSGIIEWCENTTPLGQYLNDAHKKYHPNDMSPNEARAHIKAAHMKDANSKYAKYKDVCSKLRPVFHMFFISTYPQPTIWFERRRAYMHSVATSSMVGYILGLGDRHVHNILLDTNTAEVVHIDFGIAFEQGRVLPTPETVPFRLTRDIEAGMGICGIEGVFRRSCEKTMHVLRQNSETVLTILEVLLYDPLYVWTITPAEAYSRQRDEDVQPTLNFSDEDATPVNVTAERALLRLKQKLQGTENGGVCSVEGQVELLLQQARDPVNLSRLFNGWQAYL